MIFIKYTFIGKRNQFYTTEQKLNYNCPADQKSGEGEGSCGGAKSGEHRLKDQNAKNKYYSAKDASDMFDLSNDDLTNMDDNDLQDHIKKHAILKEKLSKGSIGLVLGFGKEKRKKILQMIVNNEDKLKRESQRRYDDAHYEERQRNIESYMSSLRTTGSSKKSSGSSSETKSEEPKTHHPKPFRVL